jgi:hypothetical protein
MDGKHLVITGTLTVSYREIPTQALIECRATGIGFINQDFALNHQIPIQELKHKKQVEVIARSPIESEDITHIAKLGMKIQDHGEQLPTLVTKLGHYPIGCGITWLQLHDVAGHFVLNTITFG